MARRYQIKIYDVTYTTLAATIGDDEIFSGSVTTELSGEETLRFVLNRNGGSMVSIELAKIAELYNTVETEIYKAYRIVKIRYVRTGSMYSVEIVCESLKYDLNKLVYPFSGTIIDQTPTTHITNILNGTSWSVGTITPTTKITVQYNYDSVLSALEKVRQASIDQGELYDLDFRTKPNFVDLKIVGNQSSTATIEYAKNLLNLTYETTIPEATRMYGIGGEGDKGVPMTIEDHTHRVTSVNGDTKTLDSQKIISSDADWDGFGVGNLSTETADTIDSGGKQVGGFDTLDFTDSANVGDRLRILYAFGLKFIRDADGIANYGTRDGVFRDENFSDVINLVGPAASSTLSGTYTASLCEGWESVGSTGLSENTDAAYIINGTKSQQVIISTFSDTPDAPTATAQPSVPGDLNGTYTYKQAFVTIDGEGPLSVASASVAPTSSAVLVNFNNGTYPAEALWWRLYRTKAGGSTYYRVSTNSVVTSSFYDSVGDDKLTIEPDVTIKAAGGQGIKREFTTVVGKEYAAVVYLYIVSGRVRAELATQLTQFPPADLENRASPVGQTGKFIITLQALIATATTGEIRIVSHEGPAEFYVDSVMVVESPYAPNQDHFVADNAATELWYKTYDELQKQKVVAEKYLVDVADFYEAGIGTDKFSVGDKILVYDSQLLISGYVRIVRKTFDLLQPHNCSMDVNNSPDRFVNDYTERKKFEKKISGAASRQFTQLAGTLKTLIGSSREPSIEYKSIED